MLTDIELYEKKELELAKIELKNISKFRDEVIISAYNEVQKELTEQEKHFFKFCFNVEEDNYTAKDYSTKQYTSIALAHTTERKIIKKYNNIKKNIINKKISFKKDSFVNEKLILEQLEELQAAVNKAYLTMLIRDYNDTAEKEYIKAKKALINFKNKYINYGKD